MNKQNEKSNGKPRFDHKLADENSAKIQTVLGGLEADSAAGHTKGFRERLKELHSTC